MGSESQFQTKVKKFLESKGYYVVNVHGGAWGGKGTADLICCYKGQFIAFELKVGENQMSEAQKIRKKEVEKSGGRVFCPRIFSEVEEIVKELEK